MLRWALGPRLASPTPSATPTPASPTPAVSPSPASPTLVSPSPVSPTPAASGIRARGQSVSELVAAVAEGRGQGWGRGRCPPEVPPGWQFRDSFVPATPRQLRRMLLQEFHPSGASRADFLAFAARVDRALHPRYHRLHLHLQALYGPLDPEGGPGGPSGVGAPGGVRARRVMAALGPILEDANFQPLPPSAVAFALLVKHPRDEVEVSVKLEDYEEIQFWALGQRIGPLPHPPPAPRRWTYGRPSPTPHRYYFQRVVVLALPKEGGLELASFEGIPLDSLELLLERGKVKTPRGVRALLPLGLLLWATLLFLNLGLGLMADLKVGATGLVLVLAAAAAVRGNKLLWRRRAGLWLRLWRWRGGRGRAGRAELLAALTRRAQDEAAKELLLAGNFLRAPDAPSPAELQPRVESWLRSRFGLPLSFPAQRALRRLRAMGEDPHGPPQTPTPPALTPGNAETPHTDPRKR